jgi:ribosomal-protein-alanine N-acetyltransferase
LIASGGERKLPVSTSIEGKSMDRVVLRRVVRDDADDLIRANLESVSYHHPWSQPFLDRTGFDGWYARTLTGGTIGLIAREAASGEVVGAINLNEIVMGLLCSAHIGYHGMVRFAGQGLMTEALTKAVRFAFDDLGLHRVEANIQPTNLRSIALVRRVGFRKEGFSPRYLRIAGAWRDHERWALLADE